MFKTRFTKKQGKKAPNYVKHRLPSGCVPLLLTNKRKRIIDKWEIFYAGWERSGKKYVRVG